MRSVYAEYSLAYNTFNLPAVPASTSGFFKKQIACEDTHDGGYGFYDTGYIKSGDFTVKYVLNGEVKDTETVIVPVGTTVTKNVKISNN